MVILGAYLAGCVFAMTLARDLRSSWGDLIFWLLILGWPLVLIQIFFRDGH